MHPATHRALRELVITGRLLAHRWERLAEHCPDLEELLSAGAADADEMTTEIAKLALERDIPAGPAAHGLGTALGEGAARVGEPFLERNQALRAAVLDAHRTTMLLHYVERLASAQDDEALATACQGWAHRLVRSEGTLREHALAAGDDPGRAIEPIHDSPAGRAAHQVAVGAGSLGEWLDRRWG